MGKLIYGNGRRTIEIEDRTLCHLKPIIIAKLRRGESFILNYNHGLNNGSGRTSLWLHPTIPLEFVFYGNRSAEINRKWVEILKYSADSPEGLQMVPEPERTEA